MQDLIIDLHETESITDPKEQLNTSQSKTNSISTKTVDDSNNSDKKFFCNNCNKYFSTLGNLQSHTMIIHENNRPYKCSFPGCSKAYIAKAKLINHERTHIGVKPFICEICHKCFNEKGNLKTHLTFHSEVRPYKCSLCEKAYKSSGHLKEHIEIQHYKIKKYGCKFCGKCFGRISTLKAHNRVHTREKNFQCQFPGCGKRFTEKRNMENHYERHYTSLNLTLENKRIKKTYGPRKVEKEYEEKVQFALDHLDNLNYEQLIKEKKEDIENSNPTPIEKEENIINTNIIPIEKQENINISNVTPIEKQENVSISNIIPIEKQENITKVCSKNIKKSNVKNSNGKKEKNCEKSIKDEKTRDGYLSINSSNYNDINFMGINCNKSDLLLPENLQSFDFNHDNLNSEYIDLDSNNNDLNEFHGDFLFYPRNY